MINIKNLFKKEDKDEYLEYLKETTGKKWIKLTNNIPFSDDCYLCEKLNFYLRLDNSKGKAICTRQANRLPFQTPMGPFCEWFTINKTEVHIYCKKR